MSTPFFSILIATYNAENTIRRCLKSLAKQKMDDMEIRIIDGGSSDNTLHIIDEFTYLPIKVTSEPDDGLYDALNKGIQTSSGQWIQVLGSDDELLPNALKLMKKAIEKHSADIYAGFAWVIGNGYDRLWKVDICDFRTLVGNIPFCHNAMFASRKAYEFLGLHDLSYSIAADTQWIHRAIRAGLRFQAVKRPVVRFYLGGMSSNGERTLSESYRLIQENFPCLSEEEAKSLLFISKGWTDGACLEEILARHPEEKELARAARAARDYAPYCAQREIDRGAQRRAPFWKRLYRQLRIRPW